MSLINDALKRAKEAQQSAPREAPELQFRPVEPENPPSASAKSSLGVLLPVALVLMGLLLALLVWQRIQDHRNQVPREITVRAVKPGPAPVPAPQPPPPAAAPTTQPPVQAALSSVQTTPPPAQAPPEVTSAAAAPPGVAAGEPASTNIAILPPAPTPPKPAPPKLQGVVWNPSRPSALINGQVVFIGDRMGEYKVTRITASGVTLTTVGSGQTIVLSLR